MIGKYKIESLCCVILLFAFFSLSSFRLLLNIFLIWIHSQIFHFLFGLSCLKLEHCLVDHFTGEVNEFTHRESTFAIIVILILAVFP
jgi:hypothetical protein